MNVLDVMERAMGQIDKALNHAGNVDPACELREARAAVAELILVTREVSADMRYLMGRASAEGHDSGQSLAQQTSAKIDAALARIGGAA